MGEIDEITRAFDIMMNISCQRSTPSSSIHGFKDAQNYNRNFESEEVRKACCIMELLQGKFDSNVFAVINPKNPGYMYDIWKADKNKSIVHFLGCMGDRGKENMTNWAKSVLSHEEIEKRFERQDEPCFGKKVLEPYNPLAGMGGNRKGKKGIRSLGQLCSLGAQGNAYPADRQTSRPGQRQQLIQQLPPQAPKIVRSLDTLTKI